MPSKVILHVTSVNAGVPAVDTLVICTTPPDGNESLMTPPARLLPKNVTSTIPDPMYRQDATIDGHKGPMMGQITPLLCMLTNRGTQQTVVFPSAPLRDSMIL